MLRWRWERCRQHALACRGDTFVQSDGDTSAVVTHASPWVAYGPAAHGGHPAHMCHHCGDTSAQPGSPLSRSRQVWQQVSFVYERATCHKRAPCDAADDTGSEPQALRKRALERAPRPRESPCATVIHTMTTETQLMCLSSQLGRVSPSMACRRNLPSSVSRRPAAILSQSTAYCRHHLPSSQNPGVKHTARRPRPALFTSGCVNLPLATARRKQYAPVDGGTSGAPVECRVDASTARQSISCFAAS